MEFGILKSKIEKKLSESYSNKTFDKEIKNFKNIVLSDESLKKAYHIYNEIGQQKSFEKSFAEDFVNECSELYSNIKFSKKSLNLLEGWVKNVKTKNLYEDIDIVLAKKTFLVENILHSKNRIISNLTKKEEPKKVVKLPIEKIYEIAQENLKNYLSELNETELKQIKKYLTLNESELKNKYEILSEVVIERLESINSNSDSDTKKKIQETIDKIKTSEINSISYLKLKSLNENL
jgi:hypothetical protein